jgi:hypothetical protein
MRLSTSRTNVLSILLVLSAAAGCMGSPPMAPTHPATVVTGPPLRPGPNISIRVEGRVIDGDSNEPVAGVRVGAQSVCAPGACFSVENPAANVLTDDQGGFALTSELPQDWRAVNLRAARDGYEPSQMYVETAAASTAVLRVQRTLSIRAPESIQTQVLTGTHSCGDESWPCRRIFVESPSGVLLDIEVVPADDQVVTLIVGRDDNHPLVPTIQRRVTMAGGEVWIYGRGKVTLTARRH